MSQEDTPVHLPGHPRVAAALLQHLEDVGGSAARATVYTPLAERLGLSPAQLAKGTPGAKNAWQVRVNFSRLYLANAGLVESTKPGMWAITAAGREVLAAGDVVAGVKRAYGKYRLAKATSIERSPKPAPTGSESTQLLPSTAAVKAMASVVQLASESDNPDAFETAVTQAMTALGLTAQHIGGSGDTDILVQAPFAAPPYSVVVDAKTSKHGKIGDSQIHWHHIEQHRKDHAADYSAVVASGFHGGLVTQKALEDNVSLISANELQMLLDWHAKVLFTQEELRLVFVPGEGGSPNLSNLDSVRAQRRDQSQVLQATVKAAAEYLEGSDQPATPEAIHAYLKAKFADFELESAPSLPAVKEAVALLSNAYVGILIPDGAGFRMHMSSEAGMRRLALNLGASR